MKKLMLLGVFALVIAGIKPVAAQIPDAAVIMQRESAMPLEVNLCDELAKPVQMDAGFSALFEKLLIGTNGIVNSRMEIFQEWVVQRDQPVEYRDLLEMTDNKVIDISNNMAEIRKRIAYVLQFPPHDNTVFGFIKNGEGPEMAVTMDFNPENGLPSLHVKPMDHECAAKNTRIIAHV